MSYMSYVLCVRFECLTHTISVGFMTNETFLKPRVLNPSSVMSTEINIFKYSLKWDALIRVSL